MSAAPRLAWQYRLRRRQVLGLLGAAAAATVLPPTGSAAPAFRRGAIIRTLLADVAPEKLAGGATLFHEHLSLAPDFLPRFMEIFQRMHMAIPGDKGPELGPAGQPWFMRDLPVMVDELRIASREGVACIVDAGHPDMGRDIGFLKQLSMQSGMPIVAGFGYYTDPFYPPEISRWSEDEITDELVRQARAEPVGAFGEIGTWDVMTANERKVFRAVSRAHRATDLPIFTHTNFGKGAIEQLDLIESMGVDPKRVAIGHIGGLSDPKAAAVKALCKRGAYVGFDRQGGPEDERQIPAVLSLLEAGYADRLLFASDFAFASNLKRNGGPGYAKTVTVFGPKLRQAGVSEATLHALLVDNPRHFLACVPKVPRADAAKAA